METNEVCDDKLISKKDLLKETGISYGQLYRWKRKNIIPESWFTRKSTFTGQETFFPRKEILARVEKIRQMKDDLSLDELAEIFSESKSEVNVSEVNLVADKIISEAAYNFYTTNYGEVCEPNFNEVLKMYIVDNLLNSGDFSMDEVKMLIELADDNKEEFEKNAGEVVFTRKFGVTSCLLVSESAKVFIERNTKMMNVVSLASMSEELKTKIMRGDSRE